MFDSASVHDNTPLLSRQFITTTHRSRFRFCTPKTFFKSLQGCIAEFIGTTILMFISTMIMRNAKAKDEEDVPLMVGIGNGFLYASLVAVTMHIR